MAAKINNRIRITRTDSGKLEVRRGEFEHYDTQFIRGKRIGHLHEMGVLDFIERFDPQQRPNMEVTIDLDDILYVAPRERLVLSTVTALRKALRSPTVKAVHVRNHILGIDDWTKVPAKRIKQSLKGRDGGERIEGVTLHGDSVYLEENDE